jgi:hypothetical protein
VSNSLYSLLLHLQSIEVWSTFWPQAEPRAARAAALAAPIRRHEQQPKTPARPALLISSHDNTLLLYVRDCVFSANDMQHLATNLLGDFKSLRALLDRLHLQG